MTNKVISVHADGHDDHHDHHDETGQGDHGGCQRTVQRGHQQALERLQEGDHTDHENRHEVTRQPHGDDAGGGDRRSDHGRQLAHVGEHHRANHRGDGRDGEHVHLGPEHLGDG